MGGNGMSFPADIKGCMKDCILSLFWPRKDILGFFEKHGCTKAEVGRLQIDGENPLKRHEIVDTLFETLAARADAIIKHLQQIIAFGLIERRQYPTSRISKSVLASEARRLPKLPSPWAIRSSSKRRGVCT
jgi:hypothetical protein